MKHNNMSTCIVSSTCFSTFVGVSCGDPGIDNSNLSDTTAFIFEDVLTIICHIGYELEGNETITCQSNATWTDKPNCKSKSILLHCSYIQ